LSDEELVGIFHISEQDLIIAKIIDEQKKNSICEQK